MICLDAKIWRRYHDATLAEHERATRPVCTSLADESVFVSGVVALAAVHYLRNRHAEPDAVVETFRNLGSTAVSSVGRSTVERADELRAGHPHAGIDGRDTSVVAAVNHNDVGELWTHDEGPKRLGKRLNWLTVVAPAG